jgi:hypothetical protein
LKNFNNKKLLLSPSLPIAIGMEKGWDEAFSPKVREFDWG